MVVSNIDIISVNYFGNKNPKLGNIECEIIDRKDNPYGKDYRFFKKIPGTLFSFWYKNIDYYRDGFFDLYYDSSAKRNNIIVDKKSMITTLKKMLRFYLRKSPVSVIALLIKLEGNEERKVYFLKKHSFIKMAKAGSLEFNRIYVITK